MMGRPLVVCDSPELSSELAGIAAELDLELELVIADSLEAHPRAEMVCLSATPSEATLLALSRRKAPPVLVLLEVDTRVELLSLELGIVACSDPAAGLATLRLEREGVESPASLSLRGLSPLARRRLG